MSYIEVRKALIVASAGKPGRFIPLERINEIVPQLSAEHVSVELAALHEYGEATTSGILARGIGRTARFDGLIWTLPDGTTGTIIDSLGHVNDKLNEILIEGYETEVAS